MEKYCPDDGIEEMQEHTLTRDGRTWPAYRTFRRKSDGAWGWAVIPQRLLNQKLPAGDFYASREEAQEAAETWWRR